MSEDIRLHVHIALRRLAEKSRTTSQASGSGFHRLDLTFGCELAQKSQLSLPEVVIGVRLLRRYRQQEELQDLAVPDEAAAIDWAIEQHEPMSEEEQRRVLELTHMPEPPSIIPSKTPPTAQTEADDSGQSEKTSVAKRVYLQKGRIFVEFPYDRAKVSAIQPLKDIIEDWAFNRYQRQEWSFPQEAAVSVYEVTRTFEGFRYDPDAVACIKRSYRKQALLAAAQELEQRWQELSQQAALEAVRPYLDGAPTANGQRLFRHQREAVQRMIEAQRLILAHQMGLGKTRSSLIAAYAYSLPIWVIAPAGTLVNWQREAAAVGVEVTLYSWAKLPDPPEDLDYVLIVDEAHFAQGAEGTVRGKGFLRLAETARAVFLLTGTPLRNALPVNLWPLLVAARHPLASDRTAYELRYCAAYYRSVGRKRGVYDISGASNLEELHARTCDVILYKEKRECVDLPEKLRVVRQAEVGTTEEVAYRKDLDRLREAHLERMADQHEALRTGHEELLGEWSDDRSLGTGSPEYATALVELGIYRHAASLAKITSAIDLALEASEQGQGVLVFTAFRDSAERLATKLGADCLTGEVLATKRQAMIDRFQAGESKMLVATIGAGGIGINLTAAQVVIMMDRGWTPSEVEQAEDRAHRLGQVHNVTSVWLQYGPVDDKIDQLLQLKQERIETILHGRGKQMRGIPGIRALAKEIMESVYTGKSLAEILDLVPTEFEQKTVDLVRDDLQPATAKPARAGKKDGRLKGEAPRVRMNMAVDQEVAAFLRTLKATNQTTTTEDGYSGFVNNLVRESKAFQAHSAQHDHFPPKQE